MKKSLFAVAAVTAFAGAAQAQSSVTVYGILDVGITGTSQNLTTTSSSYLGQTKQQTISVGSSAEQSSRLGFKGTEDLGGGSSAFFTIEMGLNPTYGNLSGSPAESPTYDRQQTTNTSGSAIDNRQTFVGLKKNGIGQVALGRQYTPVFNAGAVTDAAQYTNMIGDALYSGSSGVQGGVNGYLNGMTNRVDSAVTFQSDKFAGFGVNGMYAIQNQNATIVQSGTYGGNTNWGGWGLSADYTWNKLFVTAAMQQFRTKYDTGVNNASNTINLVGASPAGGQLVGSATGQLFSPTNNTDQQSYFGATYDFGILKAYAQYINRTINQNTTNGGGITGAAGAQLVGQQLKRTAEQIGVRSYITPTIEAWASAGVGTFTPMGLNQNSAHINAFQLGSNYYLSKRTNIYAIYGQYAQGNSTYNTYSSTGVANGTYQTSLNNNAYAIGVRHTF